jgi:hypothetical protein
VQAILLKPEEKLDSMSCLAYMAPFSSVMMLALTAILEPASMPLLIKLPFEDANLVAALTLNCLAAFSSNYFNMVVTKRTSALTIQVLRRSSQLRSTCCGPRTPDTRSSAGSWAVQRSDFGGRFGAVLPQCGADTGLGGLLSHCGRLLHVWPLQVTVALAHQARPQEQHARAAAS